MGVVIVEGKGQLTDVSNDILSVQKYCQLFMHESNTKIHSKYHSNQWGEKIPIPPYPLGDADPHLIHLSLDRPHSPCQTASRSKQPFCHSTASRQTNRRARRQACINSRLRSIDCIATRLITRPGRRDSALLTEMVIIQALKCTKSKRTFSRALPRVAEPC